VRAAFDGLRYRGMLLVYLVLDVDRFTPFDAHYFPSEDVVFSRLSEPKNYAASPLPPGRTGLCVEIPATPGDELWNLEGRELVDWVLTDLRKVALPADGHVVGSLVRRLPSVYPVYDLGVERRMSEVESFLDTLPHLVSLGRQALFLHDNTHHTLEAAWLAASCVRAARFDHERWRSHRARIQGNVVED
jgi:protoporphyrinogen oxidase